MLIAAGYGFLLYQFGWWGALACMAHAAVLLAAARR